MLPEDFPPFKTVQNYFYAWRDMGALRAINNTLVMAVLEQEGREASPSAGVMDSQSVKTIESGGIRGLDAGKKINGRIPRQWKVIQTVREKFSCRQCEAISQPPAPFHVTGRCFAGPNLDTSKNLPIPAVS